MALLLLKGAAGGVTLHSVCQQSSRLAEHERGGRPEETPIAKF
jgi:hypothetical protein